jgi:hypothetical protein
MGHPYKRMTDKKLIQLLKQQNAELLKALQKELAPLRRKKYYTYKEASEILCISVEGLKTRLKRGEMFKVCNNGRPLISGVEIDRYLKSQNPGF